jgi:hypothetical protein
MVFFEGCLGEEVFMSEAQSVNEHGSEPSSLQGVQRLYINGFSVGMSLSDIYMVVETAGIPSAVILLSFTTAKTLVDTLGKVVSQFEEMTGQKLLTMEDIQKALEAKSEGERKG